MAFALNIVRLSFPWVDRVVDAKRPRTIEVLPQDVAKAKQKDHAQCAIAKACERSINLTGVLVSLSTVYLVIQRTAVRYQVSALAREQIIAFDRNRVFKPGLYLLTPKSEKLGTSKRTGSNTRSGKAAKRFKVITGVRALLKKAPR